MFSTPKETNLNEAYQYTTQSQFIINAKPPRVLANCIFCSCPNSTALSQDGTFRQCTNCRKQFKARIM